jgi:CRP/FNR family transcriptional regulator, cyclic AMP receptor protein
MAEFSRSNSSTSKSKQLANLELLGEATQYAPQMNALIQRSALFENFNLAEIRLLSQFMNAYGAEPGVEVIGEGDAGDFMMLLLEGNIDVFKRDRWNAQRLIAVLQPGHTVGEMSMIDGEPRFATCVAEDRCLVTVLTREALARIILEQPVLGAKILMELVLMLSQRLRQTSQRLVSYMDRDQS